MKKIISVVFILCIVLLCCGCENANSDVYEQTTQVSESTTQDVYEINSTVIYIASDVADIKCPMLVGESKDYSKANAIIRQELIEQINILSDGDLTEVAVDLDYAVTRKEADLVCFLFEGTFMRTGAAHGLNVAFAVNLSLSTQQIIDSQSQLPADGVFIERFRESLKDMETPDRFTKDQWDSVVAQIDQYSDREILDAVKNTAKNIIAIYPDSIVVIFPVPHPVGDYVKIQLCI